MKNLLLASIFCITHIPTSALAQSFYGLKYSIEYSEEKCNKDYPLMVTIKNHTMKNLQSVSFRIIATKHGHSTQIYNQKYNSDKIIKKFGTEILCYPFYNGGEYAGIKNQIEIDKNLTPLELHAKYGDHIASQIISKRAADGKSGFISLDPKLSLKDLNLSGKSDSEAFD